MHATETKGGTPAPLPPPSPVEVRRDDSPAFRLARAAVDTGKNTVVIVDSDNATVTVAAPDFAVSVRSKSFGCSGAWKVTPTRRGLTFTPTPTPSGARSRLAQSAAASARDGATVEYQGATADMFPNVDAVAEPVACWITGGGAAVASRYVKLTRGADPADGVGESNGDVVCVPVSVARILRAAGCQCPSRRTEFSLSGIVTHRSTNNPIVAVWDDTPIGIPTFPCASASTPVRPDLAQVAEMPGDPVVEFGPAGTIITKHYVGRDLGLAAVMVDARWHAESEDDGPRPIEGRRVRASYLGAALEWVGDSPAIRGVGTNPEDWRTIELAGSRGKAVVMTIR